MRQVLQNLIFIDLAEKFPAFCGSQSFITEFTGSTMDLILNQVNPVHTLLL